jgi:hypothetical protein
MYKSLIHKKTFYILITLITFMLSSAQIYAKEISDSEIKASWIYTITEWLNWKTQIKGKEYNICTVGRDKVYMHLKRIKRKANSEKNNIQFNIVNKSPSDDFSNCNILYISNSEQEYHINILQKANNNKGVIAISSIRGFARRGGAIEFVIKKKARLIINIKTTNNAQVSVDDKLYGWAETIAN